MWKNVSGCLHVITFSQRNAECGVKVGKIHECKKLLVWRVGMSNDLEDAACEVSQEKMLLFELGVTACFNFERSMRCCLADEVTSDNNEFWICF